MKLLLRNITHFDYFPQEELQTDLNEFGEHTGDFQPTYNYDSPIPYRGNISSPNGSTSHQFFGEEIRYTHTLVMDDPTADIKEHGQIRWKGNLYEITAVRPSINALSVALRRMENVPETQPDMEDGVGI